MGRVDVEYKMKTHRSSASGVVIHTRVLKFKAAGHFFKHFLRVRDDNVIKCDIRSDDKMGDNRMVA